MSSVPPIATKFPHRTELKRWANRRHYALAELVFAAARVPTGETFAHREGEDDGTHLSGVLNGIFGSRFTCAMARHAENYGHT